MKIWKIFVIAGGVIGLGMIPILDVLVYFAPSRYPHSPELLVETLLTYAQLYSFVKYLLVAVGIVGLLGWWIEMPEDKSQ